MKSLLKVMLLLLLVGVSSNVMAQWVLVSAKAVNKDGVTYNNVYVDPTTIINKSGLTMMWTMAEFQEDQKLNNDDPTDQRYFKSATVRYVFNCETNQGETISVGQFSGSMGEGELVATWTDPSPINQVKLTNRVEPGTVAKIIFDYACGAH